MRLHYGPIPENPAFHPEADGWSPLREPSAGLFVWLATGVGIVNGILAALAWAAILPDGVNLSYTIRGDDPRPWLSALLFLATVLGFLALLIAVHELLHAAVFPGGWLSPHTLIGVWPSKGMFYAAYDGPMSRNRFLVVLLTPLAVLSILPWLAEAIFHTGWALLPVISVVNAMAAGGDVFAAALIAWQVPAGATMQNQGWRSWWRWSVRPGSYT
jgi:hypothetical protein